MKELNIIEASALINTEFEVIYPNGNKRKNNVFCNLSGSLEEINGGELYTYTDIINAKFIPIPKPVSFMEAIKAYRENKKIYCELGPNKYTYEFNHNGIRDEIGGSLTSDEIINGKWYIED